MIKDYTPIASAISILQVVDAQGYNVEEVLQSVGMDFNPLVKTEDIPDSIPTELYNKLYTRVIWLLQDESFGLNMKQKTPAGSFRMMCMCIIHCSTLEQAIIRASEFTAFCRNLAGLPPLLLTPITYESGGTVINHLPGNKALFQDADKYNISSAVDLLHMWRRFCSWLIGKNIELVEVCFQAKKPAKPERIEELFNCTVLYDQRFNGLKFNASYLQSPLIHTEESLKAFLRSAPSQLTSLQKDDNNELIQKLRSAIGNDIGKGFPSVTELAESLNMSVRTLRRRLKAEGTSYQQFKDNLRKEAAINYLNRPELKINAVSALLGFDEPSAFHRSFKKWTKLTPGEYRQQFEN